MSSDRQTDTPRTRQPSRRRPWPGPVPLRWLLVLAFAWPIPAPATDVQEAAATAAPAPARRAPRGQMGVSLDERIKFLTKALDLDSKQQSELRKVLVAQREETLKVWADESAPAAVRVKATELIGQRTGDRIRALLNEQQRARYNPPRAPREAAPGSARPNVEAWMNRTTAN
jgi:hypothetical protein